MENRFAAARRRYLRTHMDGIYTGMLLTGTLEPHLAETGESAQAMFGRNKRDQVLVLCADERRLLTTAMLVFRNKLLSSGKPTEDVNELLIRLMK